MIKGCLTMDKKTRKPLDRIGFLIPILTVIMIWESIVRIGLFDAKFFPPPSVIIIALWDSIKNFEIFRHSAYSIMRVMLAFSISASSGIILGVLAGWFKPLNKMVQPLVDIIRPIPPIAWIPLAILWFGLGLKASIFIIFLGGFFPVFLNTKVGVEQVDSKFIEFGRILGAKDKDIMTKIVIPSALPYIFAGLVVSIGYSWMSLVAAEMFGEDTGLGYFILESKSLMRPDKVIVGMIAIGLIGLVLTKITKYIERRIIRWQPTL
jgi:ABC-type nitrate/sulfonate/bicarbonate transport system permease component